MWRKLLCTVARRGHVDVLESLASRFKETKDSATRAIIDHASMGGHVDILRCLYTMYGMDRESMSKCPEDLHSCSFLAIQNNHVEMLRLLWKFYPDSIPHKDHKLMVKHATSFGADKVLTFLKKKDVSQEDAKDGEGLLYFDARALWAPHKLRNNRLDCVSSDVDLESPVPINTLTASSREKRIRREIEVMCNEDPKVDLKEIIQRYFKEPREVTPTQFVQLLKGCGCCARHAHNLVSDSQDNHCTAWASLEDNCVCNCRSLARSVMCVIEGPKMETKHASQQDAKEGNKTKDDTLDAALDKWCGANFDGLSWSSGKIPARDVLYKLVEQDRLDLCQHSGFTKTLDDMLHLFICLMRPGCRYPLVPCGEKRLNTHAGLPHG